MKERFSITNEDGVPSTTTEIGGAVHRVKCALERERFPPSLTFTAKTEPPLPPPSIRVMEVKLQGCDMLAIEK